MKIKKKAVIAAAVFSAALNLSACAYGPPPDDWDNGNNSSFSDENSYETDSENGDMGESLENE
ncbi:MAG: hypothetical protein J1F42_06540 [Lachnospiraceae bacterium]|nr:hypothetical protein [Lachnospiraceae bacterium]